MHLQSIIDYHQNKGQAQKQVEFSEGRGLESMLNNVAKLGSASSNRSGPIISKPKLLVCAPSNAAVDELVVRLVNKKFLDANGGYYAPDIKRIGRMGLVLKEGAQSVEVEGLIDEILNRDTHYCRRKLVEFEKAVSECSKSISGAAARISKVHDLISTVFHGTDLALTLPPRSKELILGVWRYN